MRLWQTLLSAVLALVMTAGVSEAAKSGKKKHHHPVRGKVESITGSSMVVKVHQGKKKGGGTVDKTFTLASDTKFEFVKIPKHAKGEKPTPVITPASLTDLKVGERVRVVAKDASVESVGIMQGHKGKKKKSA